MRRRDVGALVQGVAVGALVAVAVAFIWTEASRPPPFPVSATSLPSPFVVSTASPRSDLPITLSKDGIGLAAFGEQGDALVGELTALLGPPSRDERWTCADPPAEIRLVGWADLGIFLFDGTFRGYIDSTHYPPEHGPFIGSKTAEGLGIGDSIEQLQALYEGRVELREPDQQFGMDVFEYFIDGSIGIHGFVGKPAEGTGVITISAGMICVDDRP